ncbi:MAG: lipid-A-disaccharide synthase [Bacteroidia bacterium]|nr:lipid-A-disaccharide synthase [Bacteroidia bacterium]
MKFFILCGEHSADIYGAKIISFLKQKAPSAEFLFTGGPLMEKAAEKKSLIPIGKMNFMGFWEVLKNIHIVLRNFSIVKKHILDFKPDVLLLVDYPGFNLKMARWYYRKTGRKAHYFISPTVWAWKPDRAFYIQRYCQKLYCILPFEKPFYENMGIHNVEYVGHPMAYEIEEFKKQSGSRPPEISGQLRKNVLLMPGSRLQEVKKHLPLMVKTALKFKDVNFVVSGMKNIPDAYYDVARRAGITVSMEDSLMLMKSADAAIIKSGTSSVQASLMGLPHMVAYRAGNLSYLIAKKLVKLQYISLINIIPDKKIVQEFIQHDFNLDNLEKELRQLLNSDDYYQNMKKEFKNVVKMLRPTDNHPCQIIADDLLNALN